MRHLSRSDALLMVVDDFKGNEELVPGKVYEYMRSGRPIITLASQGAVTEVIAETRSGHSAQPNDIPAIADIFLHYYTQWLHGSLGLDQKKDLVQQYERKGIAKHLAALLREVSS